LAKIFATDQEENICGDIFRNTMRARHLLHEMASRVAIRSGLHAAELNVVNILGKFGSITMGDLSRKTFVSPANTTSTVKKLAAAWLAKRKRPDESGRAVTVSLTPKGKTQFRQCYPQILGVAYAHMEERLTREQRVKLAAILKKFVE